MVFGCRTVNARTRQAVLNDCAALNRAAAVLRQQGELVDVQKVSAAARKESRELFRLAAVVRKVSEREAKRANTQ